MMAGRKLVKKMEEQAPAVSAAETRRRSLLNAMFGAVSDEDMHAIAAKQVEKAKEGDIRSARLIIDMIQAQPVSISVSGDNNTVNVNPTFISDTQRHILLIIAEGGPRDALSLAAELHSDRLHIHQALDHDWFERGKGGLYALTAAGKKEARLSSEG